MMATEKPRQETVSLRVSLEEKFYLQQVVDAREDLPDVSAYLRELIAPGIEHGKEIVRRALSAA